MEYLKSAKTFQAIEFNPVKVLGCVPIWQLYILFSYMKISFYFYIDIYISPCAGCGPKNFVLTIFHFLSEIQGVGRQLNCLMKKEVLVLGIKIIPYLQQVLTLWNDFDYNLKNKQIYRVTFTLWSQNTFWTQLRQGLLLDPSGPYTQGF